MTLHALTFLHPGTGQTTGVVDLPVQREVHTGFPMIASSGLKGAMREKAEQDWGKGEKVNVVFGPETNADAAGALVVTDARILLLPVRSLQQVFFWVTCPMVIDRLSRDAKLADITLSNVSAGIQVSSGFVLPSTGSGLSRHVVLEELRLDIDTDPARQGQCQNLVTALKSLAPGLAAAGLDGRLVIVASDDFQYLCRHALQVSARIALNEKKTTTGGGGNLWYEETLPPETVMYSLLLANEPRYKPKAKAGNGGGRAENGNESQPTSGGRENAVDAPPKDAAWVITAVDGLFNDEYLQVGGNETVGQGWCCVNLSQGVTGQRAGGSGQIGVGAGAGGNAHRPGASLAKGKKL
jgi:CRISPR-associated protein Cmr4